jgi:hypothetical protein
VQNTPTLPRVLLFSEKKDTSLLYKKLSVDLFRTAVLGEVHSSESALVQRFGVTSFPTILVSGGGPHDSTTDTFQWQRYEGTHRHAIVSIDPKAGTPTKCMENVQKVGDHHPLMLKILEGATGSPNFVVRRMLVLVLNVVRTSSCFVYLVRGLVFLVGAIGYVPLHAYLTSTIGAFTPVAVNSQDAFDTECQSKGGVWYVSCTNVCESMMRLVSRARALPSFLPVVSLATPR